MPTITISHHKYELLGTASLSGMMIEALGPDEKPPDITGETLTIVFERASLHYCQKHDGPAYIMMPDYVPFCLIQNILELVKRGIKIKLEVKEVDEIK
jgi:hypothetical protein